MYILNARILLANSNQLYFNNLVKTPCHKTHCQCPHRLHLTSQCSRSCAHLNIKTLKDKDLEFVNSITPDSRTERIIRSVEVQDLMGQALPEKASSAWGCLVNS